MSDGEEKKGHVSFYTVNFSFQQYPSRRRYKVIKQMLCKIIRIFIRQAKNKTIPNSLNQDRGSLAREEQ